ncbi:hypothetical protein RND71_001889 [Anisodus tanguticus]|uniref:Uncharacterized protein n=1 Tax=Anisodus tanguticus TaxID=243964 RepID=A0AAE1T357_9SOLA|nr:hypothetical protein RND71_001889 [Anisodus tanguticus]
MSDEHVEVVAMGKKCHRPDHIPALKAIKKRKMSPFIVADIEAALHNDVHVPCVVGFLVVKLCEDLDSKKAPQFLNPSGIQHLTQEYTLKDGKID